MRFLTRRSILQSLAGAALGGWMADVSTAKAAGGRSAPIDADLGDVTAFYRRVSGESFPIPAVDLRRIDRAFLRAVVPYQGSEPAGTIVIDPQARYLYLVQGDGRAMRYGVGVGRSGFGWSGTATIKHKREWPDWYPPAEMIARQPELERKLSTLQSGVGVPGGPGNPLGARALYLWQGNQDTLYRIHGTVEPWTIGKRVSSGCIRMINQDAIDLYNRVPVETQVVVLGGQSTEVAVGRPQRGDPFADIMAPESAAQRPKRRAARRDDRRSIDEIYAAPRRNIDPYDGYLRYGPGGRPYYPLPDDM